MRAYAREISFSMIYGYLITRERVEEIPLELFESNDLLKDDKLFIMQLYNGVVDNEQEYLDKISNIAMKFKIERLFKVDLSLLLMAMYEIDYIKTPIPVVINETVNLAKKFSTDKSMSFINGILAKYINGNALKETVKDIGDSGVDNNTNLLYTKKEMCCENNINNSQNIIDIDKIVEKLINCENSEQEDCGQSNKDD
ncbi:MAG: transcription antitermination factor NusB [Clostridia bacterium]